MKSFVSILDHNLEEFISILHLAARIKNKPEDYAHEMDGKILANLFFESSTRTSFSFQSAMQRLGGSVLGFATKTGTSADKGESLTDTIHMAVAYSDVIVLRHPKRGSGTLAS
ncbi:MAG: aspartate carbamoyltransferase, partial [Candidatus Hodarchaeales archaeon]